MRKFPDYAQGADRSRLVKLFCKNGCGTTRWAIVEEVTKQSGDVVRRAKCVMCGKLHWDYYNWTAWKG